MIPYTETSLETASHIQNGMIDVTSFNLKRAEANYLKAQKWLRRGIWLYFWLLLFEGALRKWVLPGLATPLLIVRDPVAIWILVYAYMHGMLKSNFYVTLVSSVTIISVIFTLLLGHGNLLVTFYGARILLIHFPLLFLIGHFFTYQDAQQIGKALLWTSIPITLLIAAQFNSPQTSWVNWSVGGEVLKYGFGNASGHFRPSGPFSFTNGLSAYYGFLSAYVFYFWMDKSRYVPRWLLIVATALLIAAVPLTISRTVLFSVALSFVFVVLIATQKPKYFDKILLTFIGGITLILILSNFSFMQDNMAVFTDRFDSASEQEGGLQGSLIDRFLGGLVSAVAGSVNYPIWGLGLGMGTNAGSQLLLGRVTYLIAEGEWGRLVGEMGPVMGLIIILVRVHLTWRLGLISYQKLKFENFMPWLLFSFAATNVLLGQWAQPTALGFSIVSGGLIIAAFKKPAGAIS